MRIFWQGFSNPGYPGLCFENPCACDGFEGDLKMFREHTLFTERLGRRPVQQGKNGPLNLDKQNKPGDIS